MINPLSFSLSGLMGAANKMNKAAQNIATADTPGSKVNLDEEIINTIAAQNDFEANAAVIARTKDMEKTLGRLLDEKA